MADGQENNADKGKVVPKPVSVDGGQDTDIPPYVDPQGRNVHPRHKRIALRKVRQLGLEARNGDEALRALADRGVDVITLNEQREAEKRKAAEEQAEKLPAERTDAENVPDKVKQARVQRMKRERDEQIAKIQRNLVRRRRRKLQRLLLRLTVFVFLPTWIVGYYYWAVATEMYETNSAFVIQTADSLSSGGGGLGGILAGTGFATSQDSVVVQDYLQSREAFGLLERDHGFTEHFLNPEIDSIQRLSAEPTPDEAYKLYSKKVKIGYDPTEGVIRMTVVAADPKTSQIFAEALVRYAEERVDTLSRAARGDRMEQAEARYRDMEAKRLQAQQKVLELQQQRGVLSADVELQSQMSIIQQLEVQFVERELALQEILDNPRPNQTQVDVLRRELGRLRERIDQRRADLTEANEGSISLARIGAELLAAQTDLETRQLLEKESLAAMEASRLEAERQVRYLSLAVRPVAPVEPTYPKKLESTAMAFLVFCAIYIMASLTISILREQVSV
ncbi:capsule biosynthesis protein [Halovulum sp. GXIMD14793]